MRIITNFRNIFCSIWTSKIWLSLLLLRSNSLGIGELILFEEAQDSRVVSCVNRCQECSFAIYCCGTLKRCFDGFSKLHLHLPVAHKTEHAKPGARVLSALRVLVAEVTLKFSERPVRTAVGTSDRAYFLSTAFDKFAPCSSTRYLPFTLLPLKLLLHDKL